MEDQVSDPKWRIRARVVGFIILFLSFFALSYSGYLTYVAAVVQFPDFMDMDFTWGSFIGGLFPFLYVWLMNNLAIAYFWSALQVLMATKFGQDPLIAYKKGMAGFGIIRPVLTILSICNIWSFWLSKYEFSGRGVILCILVSVILPVGIHIIFLIIGFKFVTELEPIITGSLSPETAEDYIERLDERIHCFV